MRNREVTQGAERLPPRVLAALFLFIGLLPFESAFTGEGKLPFTITKVIGYCLVITCLTLPLSTFAAPPRGWKWLVGYLAAFVGLFLLGDGALWGAAAGRLLTLLQCGVFYWLLSQLLQDRRVRRSGWRVYALACVTLSVFQGAGLTSHAYHGDETRLSAMNEDPNNLGGILALGAVALFSEWLYPGKWSGVRRAFALLGVFIVIRQLIATGSRGAVVALFCGLAVLACARMSLARRALTLGALGLACGLTVALILSQKDFTERWERTYYERTISEREELFPTAFSMWTEKPLLGWGPTAHVLELGSRFGQDAKDTHNLALWLLTETGAVGFILFGAVIWISGVSAWKARRNAFGRSAFALLAVVMSVNMSITWIYRKEFWFVLATCSACRVGRLARVEVTLPHGIVLRRQESVDRVSEEGRLG